MTETMNGTISNQKNNFKKTTKKWSFLINITGWIKELVMDFDLKQLLENAGIEGQVINEDIAYHGTPSKFDEFSLKYISSGVGGQAHGWGLYFTLDKGVAITYMLKLAKQQKRQLEEWENKIIEDIRDWGINNVVKNIKHKLEQCKQTNNIDCIKRFQNSLDFIDSLTSIISGTLFTVDIPNDDELLVEDDLIINQPSKVKRSISDCIEKTFVAYLSNDKVKKYYNKVKIFIRKANIPDEQKEIARKLARLLFLVHLEKYKQTPEEVFNNWSDIISKDIEYYKRIFEDLKQKKPVGQYEIYYYKNNIDYYKNNTEGREFIHNNLKFFIDMMTKNEELDLYESSMSYIMDIMNNINGRDFYNQLSYYIVSKSNTKEIKNDCLTSMLLLKYGVQGIKYYDGEDGDCVVIFNPKRVKIIGKE